MQEEFCHGGGSQELSWWPVLGRGWAGSKAVDGGAGGRVWLEMAKERISEPKAQLGTFWKMFYQPTDLYSSIYFPLIILSLFHTE